MKKDKSRKEVSDNARWKQMEEILKSPACLPIPPPPSIRQYFKWNFDSIWYPCVRLRERERERNSKAKQRHPRSYDDASPVEWGVWGLEPRIFTVNKTLVCFKCELNRSFSPFLNLSRCVQVRRMTGFWLVDLPPVVIWTIGGLFIKDRSFLSRSFFPRVFLSRVGFRRIKYYLNLFPHILSLCVRFVRAKKSDLVQPSYLFESLCG